MVAWNLLESHAFIVELGLVLGAVGCRQAAGGAHDSWWWCGCLSGRDRCSRRTDQTNGIKFIPFVCPSSIPTTAPHRTARPPGSDRCLRRTDESDKILFICPSSIPTTAPRARPAQMTVDRLKTDRRILFFFTYLSGPRHYSELEKDGLKTDRRILFFFSYLSGRNQNSWKSTQNSRESQRAHNRAGHK